MKRYRRAHRLMITALSTVTVVAAMSTHAPATIDALPADAETEALLSAAQSVRPQVAERVDFVLTPQDEAPLPDVEALRDSIDPAWGSQWLGEPTTRSLVIRDALTGQSLIDIRGDNPLTPASTTKIVTAAAIMTALPPEHTFETTVVRGKTDDEIVLVAGGDQLLSADSGSGSAVAGHAGLADLARQTARSLARDGVAGPVRLAVDLSYADGPSAAPGWTDFWLNNGYTGRISMMAMEDDRALPGDPAPSDPAMHAAASFAVSMAREGVEIVGFDAAPFKDTGVRPGPGALGDLPEVASSAEARVLATVGSAPLQDVLSLALLTSDNAMVEQLARQAAISAGQEATPKAVNAWVLAAVKKRYDVDVAEVVLADTSGLSEGTQLPVSLVADLLVAGAGGQHPGFQAVLTGLPVAGYDGTLADRFAQEASRAGRGMVRAKTGSLPSVTSLAGTVVTKEGRLLVFATTTNDVQAGAAAVEAPAALDAMLARVAACECGGRALP